MLVKFTELVSTEYENIILKQLIQNSSTFDLEYTFVHIFEPYVWKCVFTVLGIYNSKQSNKDTQ